jgi:preprotein translocase subunit SecB
MKTVKSPLELIDFSIIESRIDFYSTSSSEKLIKDFEHYKVDISFEILRSSNKTDFKIQMRVKINQNAEEGYKIDVTAIGVFSIKDISDEKMIANLINFSAINICIANLRLFIANVTSYYPIGKFVFHSIDMNELIKEKSKSIKVKQSKK